MSLKRIIVSTIIAATCAIPLAAHAQNLTALHPLIGYECMALNLSQQQLMDPSIHVPIVNGPNASAPLVGYASATVIASVSPPTNGFRRVLRLDGVPGWIETKYLKPWVNPGGNGQRCIPSAMSNGRDGFNFQ